MGFKNFMKKVAKEFKESQKPENIKKKLKQKIKIKKLRDQLDTLDEKSRKKNKDKYNYKMGL